MNSSKKPIPVALARIKDEKGNLLLVKRQRGDFTGKWGFPGGKIETREYLRQAIEREIHEETNLPATMDAYLGLVSEHVRFADRHKHVLIHMCSATVKKGVKADNASWFTNEEYNSIETVPSLKPIINHIEDHDYLESCIEETNNDYELTSFDAR